MTHKTFKILTSFFLLLFVASLNADPLVTRDDFICYDTTGNLLSNSWNYVNMHEDGTLSQINCMLTPLNLFEYSYTYQFNRFDKFGNQTQPVINFLPDTVNEDTTWLVAARLECYTNNNGITFIPAVGDLESSFVAPYNNMLGYLFDSTGNQIGERICFDCDMSYESYVLNSFVCGDISDDNILGIVWYFAMVGQSPYHDSIYVRFYYMNEDSLSDPIKITDLPMPLPHNGVYKLPSLKIAQDSSFVISWVDQQYYRTFYVAYNSDMTQKYPVQIAECMDGDSTNCTPVPHPQFQDMVMEADGDFYITWCGPYLSEPTCVNVRQVWVRGFNADGTPKYDPMIVNDFDSLYICAGEDIWPHIACDDSGNVLVIWSDARDYPGYNVYGATKRNVYAQKIDPDGNFVGPNYRLNNNIGEAGWFGRGTQCDMNNSGQAVMMWRNVNMDYRVWAQLMPYHDIGTFIPGDINLSMSTSIEDLTYFINYLFKNSDANFWPRDLVDLNGDSANGNIADLTYLVSYFFKGGSVPKTPYEGIREEVVHTFGFDPNSTSEVTDPTPFKTTEPKTYSDSVGILR